MTISLVELGSRMPNKLTCLASTFFRLVLDLGCPLVPLQTAAEVDVKTTTRLFMSSKHFVLVELQDLWYDATPMRRNFGTSLLRSCPIWLS